MKKRYKLFILLFISFILVIIIYILFHKEQKYYLFIGDNLSLNVNYSFIDYLKNDINVIEYNDDYLILDNFINILNNNENNIINKIKYADKVIISFGTRELLNYKELNSEIIIYYLKDLYCVLEKISKLNSNIVLINTYDNINDLLNYKYISYTNTLKINYILLNNKYIINGRTIIDNNEHKRLKQKIANLAN